jgi:ADP-ribosyltransferase exoenzyme
MTKTPSYTPIKNPTDFSSESRFKQAQEMRQASQAGQLYPDWNHSDNRLRKPRMIAFFSDDQNGSSYPSTSHYDANLPGELHNWDRKGSQWSYLHNLYKNIEPALGDMAAHHDKLFGIGGGKFASAAWRYTISSRPYNYAISPNLADRHVPELHTDHAILSSGLRHPSLALQEPAQVHMKIWGAHSEPLEQHLNNAVEGTKFRTNRFMSTSINPGYGTVHGQNRIVFHLPAGYNKGAYVGTISSYPHEGEFLMDHHQSFEFTHKEMKRDQDGYPRGGYDFHVRPIEDHKE